MKNGVHLLQKEHDMVQPFIAEKKTKSKSKDAPRKMHNA
jgi:hypothetical protein